MHSQASKLVNYVRNPTWVAENFIFQMYEGGGNRPYSKEEREAFRKDPKMFYEFRKRLENK